MRVSLFFFFFRFHDTCTTCHHANDASPVKIDSRYRADNSRRVKENDVGKHAQSRALRYENESIKSLPFSLMTHGRSAPFLESTGSAVNSLDLSRNVHRGAMRKTVKGKRKARRG